jgi:hypothetical protein
MPVANIHSRFLPLLLHFSFLRSRNVGLFGFLHAATERRIIIATASVAQRWIVFLAAAGAPTGRKGGKITA